MGLGTDLAGEVVGAGIGYAVEQAQTKQQRRWQLQDYERQKADQREFWDITNKYNSPEEQMNRLRQAGLNPHLVYGKGADVTAQALSGPNIGNSPRSNFKIDSNMISTAKAFGQQIQMQKAQTDNVLADTANKQLDQDLKNAQINQTNVQTANIAQNTATSEFQLQQSQELKDSVLQKAQLENESLKIKNFVQLGDYELAKIKSDSDKNRAIQEIAESKQRIATAKLQNAQLPLQRQKLEKEIEQLQAITVNTNLEGAIKQIEVELRQQGINPNDPIYVKKIWEGLQKAPEFLKTQVGKYYWGAK